ncbi:hypothetical protein [Peribacillus muralis]|uniref:hypothetical protein n=1 Tax=Peribacillus muralis TaxID=264697 RepID=UPI0036701EE8
MKNELLRLDLQHFAEDTGEGAEGTEGTGGSWVDEFLSKGKDGMDSTEQSIPKKRFDDVNNRYKTLSEDYKNRQVEYEAMSKDVEAGKATAAQLQETIDAGTKRVEALEGVLKTMLDAELELIDEEYRELVPADKPIEEQLEWLGKAKSKGLFVSKGIEFSIGGPSNPGRAGNGMGQAGYANKSPLELMQMGYSS